MWRLVYVFKGAKESGRTIKSVSGTMWGAGWSQGTMLLPRMMWIS